MLGWACTGGLLGLVTAVGGGLLLGGEAYSLVRGAALAVGVAMVGLVLVIPVTRAGAAAVPLAVSLLIVQMCVLYAAGSALRERGPVEVRSFAAAAAGALVLWQTGVVVGLIRTRTAMDPTARAVDR